MSRDADERHAADHMARLMSSTAMSTGLARMWRIRAALAQPLPIVEKVADEIARRRRETGQ